MFGVGLRQNTDICEAFNNNNQYCTIVSLDIEKACDMIWKHRIIKILIEIGCRGHILHFIHDFLNYRYIQVRVQNHLSELKELQNGVPQGSVISVSLFLIAINHMISTLPKPIKIRAFADDITLVCIGRTMSIIGTEKNQNWLK